MQEIALLLSSLAGIATAAAVRARTAHHGRLLTLGASSQISGQIKILRMEKEILAKTISRLYQSGEWDSMPRQYKEGLLARYQHQLGVVMARLEKLEDAKNHPDLGPVGDGLITLMDQKMSGFDTRIHDIASDIADIKAAQKKSKTGDSISDKKATVEAPAAATTIKKDHMPPKVSKGAESTTTSRGVPEWFAPSARQAGSFEISTLTSIPAKRPKFPNLTASSRQENAQRGQVQKPKGHVVVIKPEIQEIKTIDVAKPPIGQAESSLQQSQDAPVQPVAPGPVKPVQPVAPGPVKPVQPVAPGPVKPVQPVAPGPVKPVQPVAPEPVIKKPTATVSGSPSESTDIVGDYDDDEEKEEAEIRNVMKDIKGILDKINKAESE